MSTTAVDAKVIQQINQISEIKKSVSDYMKTILSVTESGAPAGSELPRFWYLVDSVGDEDYENTIKGQEISDMDKSLLSGAFIGNGMSSWFNLHESYYQIVRGFANGFSDFLEFKHMRVSSYFNDVYNEARGISLNIKYVYQDDISYNLATITGITTALVNGGIIDATSGDTKLAVGVSSGTASGNATLTLVLNDKTDEVTRSIDVSITSGMDTNDQVIVGQVTPTSIIYENGMHKLTVPNIINFKSNTYVTVENVSTLELEYVLVSEAIATSGGAGTITVPLLLLDINTVSNLRVTPVFNGITSASISSSVGNFKIYPIPDRAI